MGKIFKALEKAEKKDLAKLAKFSAAIETTTHQPEIDTPNAPRPVVLSKTQRVVPAPPQTVARSAKSPAKDKTNRQTETQPSTEPSPSSTARLSTSSTIPTPGGQLPLERMPDEKETIVDETTPSTKSDPHFNKQAEQSVDAINLVEINAEKAYEASQPIKALTRQPDTKEKIKLDQETKGTAERKRINVRYSKTRVQFNDLQKLKNNKVLSIFDDIDTANQFKILRTQVLRKLKEIGGNSILVTSANPYEGKTFTSINLGLSIAKEFDRTVLIIDADIRRQTKQHTDFATEFFSLKVEKGLTDYLAGDADIEEILINPGIDKITLIPGGVPADNSPELLNSSRMEEMMAEIKSRYPSDRLIIVDGPALLHFPDAMILYRYVDGVLPVVESEKTSTEDLKKLMKHLKDVNLLGVVLNKNKG
jgi:protein-tyrosine kinase